ncbi:MAG: hypothetical protein ACREQ5_00995 [Candidatus Dormibacteria bacterium]
MTYLDEAARLASLVDNNSMTREAAEAAFVQYLQDNGFSLTPVGKGPPATDLTAGLFLEPKRPGWPRPHVVDRIPER